MSSLALSRSALAIARLGRQPYQKVWELQRKLQTDLIAGCGQETLIVCEHAPVITLGRSGKRDNLLLPEAKLNELGIAVLDTERGGDVTFHGPGQLVAYPILDLRFRKRDVNWYIRSLEEVVILTLASFRIEGKRVNGRAGVWIDDQDNPQQPQKVACVGVRISRWCTMHGVALNAWDCSRGFSLINPCGYRDIEVTSIEQITGSRPDLIQVQDRFINCFGEIFCESEVELAGNF